MMQKPEGIWTGIRLCDRKLPQAMQAEYDRLAETGSRLGYYRREH